MSGSFAHHYQGHTPIGPSCCVADVTPTQATIWSNTQNIESLVSDLANVLAPLSGNQIRVLFYEGSGSFGNGTVAFDTAESAAIMSLAVGKPVRLQFMRWDEHGWTHYAPAILYDMRAGVDGAGNIVAYEATGFGQGGTSIYTGRELAGPVGAPTPTANAIPTKVERSGAVTENISPWMKVVEHELPADQQADRLDDGHLPQRPDAGSGCPADDVRRRAADGHARGRVRHGLARVPPAEHADRLDEPALVGRPPGCGNRRELEAVGLGLEPRSKENIVTGRGIANSHHGGAYAAVVADISVNKKTGKILVDASLRLRTPVSRSTPT